MDDDYDSAGAMLQTLEHVSITLDIARNLLEVLETAQERLGLVLADYVGSQQEAVQ